MPPKRRLPSIPPASPPANPCIKGLRLKNPPEGCPGVPREGFRPGVLRPGEAVDGFDGVLGEEKLRPPRLPIELPPPARAQALDSKKVDTVKKTRTKSAIPAISFFLIATVPSFICASFQWLWSHPQRFPAGSTASGPPVIHYSTLAASGFGKKKAKLSARLLTSKVSPIGLNQRQSQVFLVGTVLVTLPSVATPFCTGDYYTQSHRCQPVSEE